MLIQITNKCHMNCPHCFQNSNPNGSHMSESEFYRAINLVKVLGARVVVISGGEPTLHPKFYHLVATASKMIQQVVIATNGTWLHDESFVTDTMFPLLKDHSNVSVQVTAIRGLYPYTDQSYSAFKDASGRFVNLLKANNMKRRYAVTDERSQLVMHAHGRALSNPEFVKEAENDTSSTTLCLKGSVVASQFPDHLDLAIRVLEDNGKFCIPCIHVDSKIRWSESMLCPSFASTHDPIEVIVNNAYGWSPCGKCLGYKKFLKFAETDNKYSMAKMLFESKSNMKEKR